MTGASFRFKARRKTKREDISQTGKDYCKKSCGLYHCYLNNYEGDEIDTWDKLSGAGKIVFYAYCCDCGCQGPTAESEAEAIDAWNRREK